jgi:ABC-type Fe3+/spermidine/putrescine transport system ATPase subunit
MESRETSGNNRPGDEFSGDTRLRDNGLRDASPKDASPLDVELSSITKNYGAFTAVDRFSLAVPRGSFTTLLGPSGCGKTTLLRIIAGFFEPDGGTVRIGGIDQRGIPPEKRGTGIVFQDYALFPHMTVEENLAYGLTIRRVPGDIKKRKTAETAETLGIGDLLGRYPGELSGGQQQRLALGRVIILKPQILLMDEPLSNLDAKLRLRVRDELKDIQRRLGITTIYVTHDQEEALSLSDEIAVMNRGRLEQLGTPGEVYNRPATAFAADFSGRANFLEIGGKKYLVRPEWMRVLTEDGDSGGDVSPLRDMSPLRDAPSLPPISALVRGVDFFGKFIRLRVWPQGELSAPSSEEDIAVDIPPHAGDGLAAGKRVRLLITQSWELPGPF